MENIYDALNALTTDQLSDVRDMINAKLALTKTSCIKDKTFVLTGTLPTLTRAQATKIITDNGGRVVKTVNKSTDFLLVGEHPGSKWGKGVNFNTPYINEAELLSMVGQ